MDIFKKHKVVQRNEQQKSDNYVTKSSNYESKSNVKWSNKDKRILLEALKKYGSENVGAISKMLPNIPLQDIKTKIFEYSLMAKYLCENELLNNWLKCGLYHPEDSLIPEALLFIQLFEDHPSPSETEGYNIRAIYNFLYRSCFEQLSYYDLSSKDRDLLCFLLSKVEQKSWPQCQSDIWQYIGRVYNKRNIKNVYPGKNGHSL
ncbi:hypothetical protein WH47_07429 [Habropoda laboriosa]|uniref:Myb-like domain-containing protein n=1 Tax=Habropoda laboriosa TaxID=597456 RepID=A0A0L7QQB3_9HYME|nr:PREDICTED: uncharacterized protein LOC108576576 [Habropoda laboriosa]KOC60686.1 hypothetical protein WH47_07429 [Habropoda laboriosa]